MPVELQSDLITSEYWQAVKAELGKMMPDKGLAGWTIRLQPSTRKGRGAFDPIGKVAEILIDESEGEYLMPNPHDADADQPRDSADEILVYIGGKL